MDKRFEETTADQLRLGDRFKTYPNSSAVLTVAETPRQLSGAANGILIPLTWSITDGSFEDGSQPGYNVVPSFKVYREVDQEETLRPKVGDKILVTNIPHMGNDALGVPYIATVTEICAEYIYVTHPTAVGSLFVHDGDYAFPVAADVAEALGEKERNRLRKEITKAKERYDELVTALFGNVNEAELDTTIRVLQRYRSQIENRGCK